MNDDARRPLTHTANDNTSREPLTHTTPRRRTALLLLAFVALTVVSLFTVLLPELQDEAQKSESQLTDQPQTNEKNDDDQ